MAWDLIDEGSLLENSETKPGAFDSRSPVPDRLAAVVPLCPRKQQYCYCRTELECPRLSGVRSRSMRRRSLRGYPELGECRKALPSGGVQPHL